MPCTVGAVAIEAQNSADNVRGLPVRASQASIPSSEARCRSSQVRIVVLVPVLRRWATVTLGHSTSSSYSCQHYLLPDQSNAIVPPCYRLLSHHEYGMLGGHVLLDDP